jgi:serine protease
MSSYHDPGGIYSAMPTYDVYLTTAYGYSTNYDQLQGTSMAAPQVSGLAGLLFAVGVSDSNGDGQINDEIRNIIESTSDDLGRPGWDREYGWGRVNAYSAVLAATGGSGQNQPPTSDFAYTVSNLTATFTDQSTDFDGSVVSWSWDFGDNLGTSTEQNPTHTYTADGTYAVSLTVTDDGNATDTVTKNVTVSSGASGSGTLYVSAIDMSSKTAGPNRSAIAVVTIKDTGGNPVDGATVYGAWSGDYTGTVSGVTGTDGTVSFESGKVRQAGASFTFTVDDVVKSGYTYDSNLNPETSGSITVP